jgi:hypothetical protein
MHVNNSSNSKMNRTARDKWIGKRELGSWRRPTEDRRLLTTKKKKGKDKTGQQNKLQEERESRKCSMTSRSTKRS